MCTVSLLTACTSGAASPRPAKPAIDRTVTPHRATSGHTLGAPGCRPASPVTVFNGFLPEVEGTGHRATLWGLLMFPHPLPARVGDQEKIVWRVSGLGPLTLVAIAPDGQHVRLSWGPGFHTGSNFDKPGDEWGAGYVFTHPGCWDLRAIRGRASADVWLKVIKR
ncbi:MAG TPA: hypothetical protein VLM11_04265 [Streptosporangiaceae bacterium]|nr:hypothetical protein [Streptosporangiaceae bacterium]